MWWLEKKTENSSLNFSKEIFQDGQDSPSQYEVRNSHPGQSCLDNLGTQLELSQKNKRTENRIFLNLLYHVSKWGWSMAYRFGEKIILGSPISNLLMLSEKEAERVTGILLSRTQLILQNSAFAELTRRETQSPISLPRIQWGNLTGVSLGRKMDRLMERYWSINPLGSWTPGLDSTGYCWWLWKDLGS